MTRSIAVGSQPFVESVKKLLGIKAKGRKVVEGTEGFRLKKEGSPYQALFEVENSEIDHDNAYHLDINVDYQLVSVARPNAVNLRINSLAQSVTLAKAGVQKA